MILMVAPLVNNNIIDEHGELLKDILYFVYDKVYVDSFYADIGEIQIEGYRSYIAELKSRIEATAHRGYIKPLRIPKRFSKLFNQVRKLGLEDQLNLY